MSIDTKIKIDKCIKAFSKGSLSQNALDLFAALGYNTDRQAPLPRPTYKEFKAAWAESSSRFNEDTALVKEWKCVDLLFQLSKNEVTQQNSLFDTKRVDSTIIETYLFFAIELSGSSYSRTALSQITREVNKLFPMPVMILFKTDGCLTLSVINRRRHKRDESKDVLEKVTLIKDISIENPHRAHIEILFDLSFEELLGKFKFTNFVELHNAWQKTLDTKELNKRFYQELSYWYFWAKSKVHFPDDLEKSSEKRNSISLIRLITRVIFIWFIKEKNLIPEELFEPRKLSGILKEFNRTIKSSSFYSAILQNLFFGTLNQKMQDRAFAKNGTLEENRDAYGVKNMFRYADQFSISEKEAKALFNSIPFLNGGLFDCLDKPDESGKILYSDGFSRNPKKQAIVPDHLFFGHEQACDLNDIFGTHNKQYKVKGLIEILQSYKFTIAENTPLEEEVALDPELLGKVFENLLASYNPETETTARKQTGSFYTPREIVDYMVDESLVACLKSALLGKTPVFSVIGCSQTSIFGNEVKGGQLALTEKLSGSAWQGKEEELETNLRQLLSYTDEKHAFGSFDVNLLINAIDSCKILDPACGSGAFPMGILHKLVLVLHKLDPHNEKWEKRQIQKARQIDDATIRDNSIADIEEAFKNNELDYGRKLYLIENCIYGVDIQPIAVQIAKLRFFISLVIDQNKHAGKDNLGIRSLPNLETKFVAANTLLSLDRPQQTKLHNVEIEELEAELKSVRHDYFSAKSRKEKLTWQKKDKELRVKIAALLEDDGWDHTTALQVAQFDPYDQNRSAGFFDLEWMFGFAADEGFDVVIGNPPYVRQEQIKEYKPVFKSRFKCFTGVADLYVYFYEKGLSILNPTGVLTFISSNKYFRSGYGEKLRKFIGDNYRIRQLIDFGDAPVFDAIAYPCIAVIQNGSPEKGGTARVFNWEIGPAIEEFERVFAKKGFAMPQSELRADGWRLEGGETLRLLDKLRKAGKPLGEYVEGKFYYGIKTGLNEAFVVDRETRDRLIKEHGSSEEVLKPFLRGRDVKRWKVESADLWLIFMRHGTQISKYPSIKKHLEKFREQLEPKPSDWPDNKPWVGRKPGSYKWYEIQDNISYWKEFEKPKIIYPNICKRNEFAWDDLKYYANQKSFIIPGASKYLLGVLNSNIVFWLFDKLLPKLQGEFYEPSSIFIEHFPIALKEDDDRIEYHASKILEKGQIGKDTSSLESRLDALVAHLYRLTLPEYTLILNDLKLSDEVKSACLGEFEKIAAEGSGG
jgi:type I restriction-modification system DNA methylase subunit